MLHISQNPSTLCSLTRSGALQFNQHPGCYPPLPPFPPLLPPPQPPVFLSCLLLWGARFRGTTKAIGTSHTCVMLARTNNRTAKSTAAASLLLHMAAWVSGHRRMQLRKREVPSTLQQSSGSYSQEGWPSTANHSPTYTRTLPQENLFHFGKCYHLSGETSGFRVGIRVAQETCVKQLREHFGLQMDLTCASRSAYPKEVSAAGVWHLCPQSAHTLEEWKRHLKYKLMIYI